MDSQYQHGAAHQPGDVINDRYEILASLGMGSMGTTYQGRDRVLGGAIAVKTLSLRQAGDWKLLELFEREARVLKTLSHPAIPQYIDYFHLDTPSDRQFYLVRELAEGVSLTEWIEQGGRADEDTVKAMAIQLLTVLDYLHRLTPPVIHRDIKPENVIRREDGQLYLVDFGSVQDIYRYTMSKSGTFVGTVGYMPLEQFRGEVFPSSDLYALGATLVYVLTRRSPDALPQKRMKLDIRPYLSTSPAFTRWLEHLLEPAIEDRFQTAQEALDALQWGYSDLPDHPHKPAGSRIVLHRSSDHLTLDLPPAGIKTGSTGIFVFAVFWVGFIAAWTIGAMSMGAPIFVGLFSIPFWLIGLGMLSTAFSGMFTRVRLSLDRQQFELEWRCLGFKRKAAGRTRDLITAEVSANPNIKIDDQPLVSCLLREGVYEHRFGYTLRPIEREWIVAEITEFLKQVNR